MSFGWDFPAGVSESDIDDWDAATSEDLEDFSEDREDFNYLALLNAERQRSRSAWVGYGVRG